VTSERRVEIPEEAPYTGGPFIVGEELTIYQAARVYLGGHPGGKFIEGASIDALERFLGKEAPDGARTLVWDIYCELLRRVEAGAIKPVRAAYLRSGKLDTRDTVIKTEDVASLARERGEAPKYLAPWMIDPPTDMHVDAPGPEAESGAARKPPMSEEALQHELPSFLKGCSPSTKLKGRRFNQGTARGAAEDHFKRWIERSRFRIVYQNAGLNQKVGRPPKTPPKS
jgi:hypothetical protein